ncbi:hypothetical protein M422DRAFT_270971 [Sphaerobolus stellatus SS14]|uniref:Uncharacterized protein n=1 Tax=Sphaerobolus stellatus (strain SS14) TaxID=990650 RepID=A0A0C9U196_SPHS4|nr:hypothetical protein M422DRAFT_270971 [Sphaerobolus stellatus SS14]
MAGGEERFNKTVNETCIWLLKDAERIENGITEARRNVLGTKFPITATVKGTVVVPAKMTSVVPPVIIEPNIEQVSAPITTTVMEVGAHPDGDDDGAVGDLSLVGVTEEVIKVGRRLRRIASTDNAKEQATTSQGGVDAATAQSKKPGDSKKLTSMAKRQTKPASTGKKHAAPETPRATRAANKRKIAG